MTDFERDLGVLIGEVRGLKSGQDEIFARLLIVEKVLNQLVGERREQQRLTLLMSGLISAAISGFTAFVRGKL